jgi:hypothetical protein
MGPSNLRNALMVRLTDQAVIWLQQASALAGLPPSTYARRILEREASRDLRPKGQDDDAA